MVLGRFNQRSKETLLFSLYLIVYKFSLSTSIYYAHTDPIMRHLGRGKIEQRLRKSPSNVIGSKLT